MKGNRDVKFIIYQVLYIFVVCVIALKGANLDLSEVISKDNVVKKQYADSLKAYIDSILALGLVPKIDIDTSMIPAEEYEKLKIQLSQMQLQVQTITPQITQLQQPQIEQQKLEQPPEIKREEGKEQIIEVQVPKFTQYLSYTIKNPYSTTLTVLGDGSVLANVSPGASATIKLSNQKSITYKVGNSTGSSSTSPKPPPKVVVQRLAPSGDGVSLRTIQSQVGYRISIDDPAPDQLKVKFSGPVVVKQSGSTFDVTLNFLNSKSQFDNYTDNKDSPYTISFNVSITDAAGQSVTRTGQFSFSDW